MNYGNRIYSGSTARISFHMELHFHLAVDTDVMVDFFMLNVKYKEKYKKLSSISSII